MIPVTPPSLLDRLRLTPNDEAWRQFHGLYQPLLQRWLALARVPASDADDLIQEILRAVLKQMPGFVYDPSRGRFSSWLRTILTNLLKDYQRKRGRFIAVAEDAGLRQTIDALEAPERELAQQWDREHDQHILNQLLTRVRPDFEPRTWQAFLRVLHGEEPAQVAKSLGLSLKAVYSAKGRILSRLREEARGLVDS